MTVQQSAFDFAAVMAPKPTRRNLVIEAGAGTGKTTAIVAEVLKLMLGDEELAPERIVLVTFTEKAAGEIADRIHQALVELEMRFDDERIIWPIGSAQPLFEVPNDRKDAYRRACGRQLARIDSLRSQTIHSFCQTLLRTFPIEAGLDPQFKIIEGFERSLLYGQLYDAWVDEETRLHPDPRALEEWEFLLAHVGYLFLIRDIVFSLVDRRDLLTEEGYAFGGVEDVEASMLEALTTLRGFEANRICEYARTTPLPAAGSSLEVWLDYFEPVANEIRTTDLPKGKRSPATTQLSEAMKVLRVGNKGDSVYDHLASHRAAIALHALARRFVAFLEREKRKMGVVDFDDLLLRTAALLEDEHVLERVRKQYDYLFVDEFQDTDRTQAKIIDRLARDRSGAFVSGKTVLVGDPKQSIYGFRRADPETYERMTRELIAAGAAHRIIADQYRSDPPLLDAINAMFGCMFPENAPRDPNVFQPPYHALRAGKPASSRELDARITLLRAEHEEKSDRHFAEAEAMAEWIAAHRDGGPRDLQRFAVLFRRLTKIDDYLDTLDRYGIDYVLPPTRLFLDRRAPVDLVAVLRAVAYAFDRGAEISAARTPYFALTDEEIVAHFMALRNADPDAEVVDETGAYARFLLALNRYRDDARHLTVSQLIDLIVTTTNIEAVYNAAADGEKAKRHLEHLRAIAFDYDAKIGGSVRQFVDEIARRRSEPDEMEPSLIDETRNAVRIMTVHAAKGLEFETVILPDLEFPVGGPELYTVEEPRSLVMRGQVETLSATHHFAGATPLKDIGKQREEAELRRLFYVGVTRARSEVVFVLTSTSKNMGFRKCVSEVLAAPEEAWPAVPGRDVRALPVGGAMIPVAFERMHSGEAAERTRHRLSDAALEARLAAAPIVDVTIELPAPVETLPPGEQTRIRARQRIVGTLLHRLLERWDGTSPAEPLLELLAAELAAPPDAVTRVRRRLATIVQSDMLRRMAAAETIGRELPIRFLDDGRMVERRVDRLIREPGREPGRDIVIDYKSGKPSPARLQDDRAQVAAYAQAIAAITGRPCSAILWYIDLESEQTVEVDA